MNVAALSDAIMLGRDRACPVALLTFSASIALSLALVAPFFGFDRCFLMVFADCSFFKMACWSCFPSADGRTFLPMLVTSSVYYSRIVPCLPCTSGLVVLSSQNRWRPSPVQVIAPFSAECDLGSRACLFLVDRATPTSSGRAVPWSRKEI